MFSRSELEAKLPSSTWTKVVGKLDQIEAEKKASRVDQAIERTAQYVADEAAHLQAVQDWYDAQEAIVPPE